MFKARLALIAEMDQQLAEAQKAAEPAGAYTVLGDGNGLREELADFLHSQVAAMNIDNFVVRPQRKSVEKFAARDAW